MPRSKSSFKPIESKVGTTLTYVAKLVAAENQSMLTSSYTFRSLKVELVISCVVKGHCSILEYYCAQ